jgi:hypothetical protein
VIELARFGGAYLGACVGDVRQLVAPPLPVLVSIFKVSRGMVGMSWDVAIACTVLGWCEPDAAQALELAELVRERMKCKRLAFVVELDGANGLIVAARGMLA